jgi:hypothetical protein
MSNMPISTATSRNAKLTIPPHVDTEKPGKADERVPHESYSSALGRGAEKGHLGSLLAQLVCVKHGRVPRYLGARALVVVERVETNPAVGGNLDDAVPTYLEEGRHGRAKMTNRQRVSNETRTRELGYFARGPYTMHRRAMESACSSTRLTCHSSLL